MTLRLTLALACLLTLLPACGGGDPHQEMAEKSLDMQKQMVEVLSKITDKESAEKHKGDIEEITQKIQDMAKEAEAMEQPSDEALKSMGEALEAELAPVTKSMQEEMGRIMSNPELAQIIMPAMTPK